MGHPSTTKLPMSLCLEPTVVWEAPTGLWRWSWHQGSSSRTSTGWRGHWKKTEGAESLFFIRDRNSNAVTVWREVIVLVVKIEMPASCWTPPGGGLESTCYTSRCSTKRGWSNNSELLVKGKEKMMDSDTWCKKIWKSMGRKRISRMVLANLMNPWITLSRWTQMSLSMMKPQTPSHPWILLPLRNL